MKAIVHVCHRAPGLPDLEHDYRAEAKRSQAERLFEGSRVLSIDGDTRGIGVIIKEPGHERGMMAVLSGPKVGRPGRLLRQVILSAESMPNATLEEFEAALGKLMEAARKWVKTYAPGCRWIAFAHQDRNHPHVHIVVENWDYKHGRRRLNLCPTLLEDMQKMAWCAELGIVTGKGSMERALEGMKLAEVGIDLEAAETWQERVELCAWHAFASREDAAKELLLWCVEKQPEKTVESLLDALCSGPLPPGWELKNKTKSGGDLRKPSVKIGGTTIRLATFIDVFAPRLKVAEKSVEKNQPKSSDAPKL